MKEMGFSKSQSEIAITNHGNVQVALENIFVPSKVDKCNLKYLIGLLNFRVKMGLDNFS
jgi:hypothetical protein